MGRRGRPLKYKKAEGSFMSSKRVCEFCSKVLSMKSMAYHVRHCKQRDKHASDEDSIDVDPGFGNGEISPVSSTTTTSEEKVIKPMSPVLASSTTKVKKGTSLGTHRAPIPIARIVPSPKIQTVYNMTETTAVALIVQEASGADQPVLNDNDLNTENKELDSEIATNPQSTESPSSGFKKEENSSYDYNIEVDNSEELPMDSKRDPPSDNPSSNVNVSGFKEGESQYEYNIEVDNSEELAIDSKLDPHLLTENPADQKLVCPSKTLNPQKRKYKKRANAKKTKDAGPEGEKTKPKRRKRTVQTHDVESINNRKEIKRKKQLQPKHSAGMPKDSKSKPPIPLTLDVTTVSYPRSGCPRNVCIPDSEEEDKDFYDATPPIPK